MKTVLLLHRGGDIVRGSERCLFENAAILQSMGVRTILVRNHPSVDAEASRLVDAIVPFDFPEIMVDGADSSYRFFGYARQLYALLRLIDRYGAHAILTNGGLPCQLGVPAARMRRIPILCQIYHPAPKRYLYLWMVNRADELLFPSNSTRAVVLGKTGRDGHVLYLGVDSSRFSLPEPRDNRWRQALGIRSDAVVFGQVSALEPHKRQGLLIEAFAEALRELPGAHLVLVGAGADAVRLSKLAADLRVSSQVHLTGYVESTLPYFQSVMDVNVLASAEEGLGLAAIEGAAAYLPLVAADATGLRETLIPGETGLVFPVDDQQSLTKCLVRLGGDPALRARFGEAGRRFVERTFSPTGYRQGFARTVERLLGAHPH